MIVALSAAKGTAQPRGRYRPHALGTILREILFRLRSALARHHIQTVVTRRHELLRRRIRQQISRELLDRKLVETLIRIERVDHVVAIRKDALILVTVETDRVREARDIEPPHRHALAEMCRAQEAIDVLLIGVAKKIPPTRRQLFRRRRQTREIQRHAAQQAVHRRLGG